MEGVTRDEASLTNIINKLELAIQLVEENKDLFTMYANFITHDGISQELKEYKEDLSRVKGLIENSQKSLIFAFGTKASLINNCIKEGEMFDGAEEDIENLREILVVLKKLRETESIGSLVLEALRKSGDVTVWEYVGSLEGVFDKYLRKYDKETEAKAFLKNKFGF